MRSLIAIEYVSVDGVMENPAWTAPYFNDEVGAFQRDQLFASDGLLLGRVTYQGMAAAWPTVRDTDGFAERINRLPKYVITKQRGGWPLSAISDRFGCPVQPGMITTDGTMDRNCLCLKSYLGFLIEESCTVIIISQKSIVR